MPHWMHHVQDAGAAAGGGLEAVRFGDDQAVGQVAAVAPAHDADAIGIGDAALVDDATSAGEMSVTSISFSRPMSFSRNSSP